MEDHLFNLELRLKLQKILVGYIKCKIGNSIYNIQSPTPIHIYEADCLCQETYKDAVLIGVFSEDELYKYLLHNNLWSLKKQDRMITLPSIMDNLKCDLWYSYTKFQGKRCDQLRKQISKNNEELRELSKEKYKYDIYAAHGVASLVRTEYLVSCNLLKDGHVFDIDDNAYLLKNLTEAYFESQVSDSEIRKLSQTNAWRNTWSAGKNSQELFGIPAIYMTEEQKSLIGWSKLYNNVYESMDCPPDEVIEDDLLLDGWLIVQSRKRNDDKQEKLGQKHKGKASGAQEVFIPAETREDAQRINALNSPHAQAIKRQRAKMMARHGKVKEEHMPDSRMAIQQKAMQQFQKTVKGK